MNTPVSSQQSVVKVDHLDDGAVWHARLNTPKANILDAEKIAALTSLFESARHEPGVRAVVIEGEGPHFSFGASVQEHMPAECARMLESFHSLFRTMLDSSVPTIAAVRGQCLGGGLELAAFCNRVIATADARLGQPEIMLGVFAPVASLILGERMGRGAAEDLLLSGRTVDGAEAYRLGLVDEINADPGETALAWARTHLVPHSGSSLRLAVRASRLDFSDRFRHNIAQLESLYLNDLMRTADANEGLQAFMDKRPPEWKHE